MISNAINDLRAGWRLRALWLALAREDISDQHKQTVLGPLWLLLNYALYVGAFLIIFGNRAGIDGFPLYVATGMLIWLMMQEAVTQSVVLFRREERYIKGTSLPISVYVLKLTVQSLIRLGYASIGWIAIVLYVGLPPAANVGASLIGLALVLACIPAVCLLLSIIGVFLPDMAFIVNNLMRIGMFLTPIFWAPMGDNLRSALYLWNPFTHLIEIVRLPLMTGGLPLLSLGVSLLILLVSAISALFMLGGFRRQIVYML